MNQASGVGGLRHHQYETPGKGMSCLSLLGWGLVALFVFTWVFG
jgi:hypothetical protein